MVIFVIFATNGEEITIIFCFNLGSIAKLLIIKPNLLIQFVNLPESIIQFMNNHYAITHNSYRHSGECPRYK